MRSAFVAVLALGLVFPLRASAQGQTFLHGRVIDSLGHPLQGARVQVLPTGASASTGADGVFELGPLDPGSYRVGVRRIGFAPDTVTVAVPYVHENVVIRLATSALALDTVFTSALEAELPRVMERTREHIGATVYGPELMKEYPAISIDNILATDPDVYPFMKSASFCGVHVYVDGKRMLPSPPRPGAAVMHPVIPDMHIRDFVHMKDVAAVEVYRNAPHRLIEEPWIDPGEGTSCGSTILIWTKGFKQRPYHDPIFGDSTQIH